MQDRQHVALAGVPLQVQTYLPRAGDRPRRVHRKRLPAFTVVVIAIVGIVGYGSVYPHFLKPSIYPVVRSDGAGYYSYLPAYLIHRDPSFHTTVERDLQGATEYATGFSKNAKTGNYLQRYPVGEAVMVAPFFLFGHWLARVTGVRADGYSGIEQRTSGAAALVYMIAGLLLLTYSLRRYFGPVAVSLTLVSIVFGTNLFHYSTFDSMYSHAFSFFLLAAFIELVHRWYESPASIRVIVAMAAVTGMILLVRQSNALFLLLLPMFGMTSSVEIVPRANLLWARRRELGVIVAIAGLMFVPQLFIWHEATGHWFINPYKGSGAWFQFGHPQIWGALFSFNPHGLFPWSPLLLLACIGFIPMWRRVRPLAIPIVLALILNAYVIASWSNWYYGAGYGHRAFVDCLPLMTFPLAALYSSVRSVLQRLTVIIPAAVCCILSVVQMVHYWQLKVPFPGASWSEYVRLLKMPL